MTTAILPEEFQKIFDHLIDGAIIADVSTKKIFHVNRAACELFGYTEEEFVRLGVNDIHPESALPEVLSHFDAQNRGKEKVAEYLPCLRKDGTEFVADIAAFSLELTGRRCQVGFFRDVTARNLGEQALRNSEQLLAHLVEESPVAVIRWNPDFEAVVWNRAAERLFGFSREEVIGKSALDNIFLARDREIVTGIWQDLLAQKGNPTFIVDNQTKDGTITRCEWHNKALVDEEGTTLGVTSIAVDVSEKTKLEESLRHRAKLESLEFLAGGIAHDFNNLLSGMFGFIELARRETAGPATGYLDRAIGAFNQLSDLNRQLLTFAKEGEPKKKPENIGLIAKNSTEFSLSGSNVVARFSIPADLWPCEVDGSQMGQVFNNIVLNARQSMPLGGTVEVSCHNLSNRDDIPDSVVSSKAVLVQFRDHGIGIPNEHLERIFDPFFTTKKRGSGLGLATSFSVVNRHNGAIEVQSELGTGTLFSVYLPAVEPTHFPKAVELPEYSKGYGTVLVMDDEEVVRLVAKEMLSVLGYQVELATNGDQAIEMFQAARKDQRSFDVVILDLTVAGGLGGTETLLRLREIDPEVLAIASSGYADDPVLAEPEKHGFQTRLVKPYRLVDISREMKKTLGESRPIAP